METDSTLSSARYTPRMQRLLSVAQDKAEETIGAPVIGTEHMLFALAGDPDGIAGRVLDELGVRARVRDRLGGS